MMQIADLMSARYEEGARGPDAFDCFGLFAELCRRRGQPIPDHPTPHNLEQREEEITAVAAAEWHPLDAPEVGCAVVLRLGPWMSHIGMVIEGGKFIHASSRRGVTVQRLDAPEWQMRIAGFYRYTGGCA